MRHTRSAEVLSEAHPQNTEAADDFPREPNFRCKNQTALPLPTTDEVGQISQREWFRLFKNKVFRICWRMQKQRGDITPSGYQYHLCKECLCNGLTVNQTYHVILHWRYQHGLTTKRKDHRKLLRSIIPKA